jgi:hypothetical protein
MTDDDRPTLRQRRIVPYRAFHDEVEPADRVEPGAPGDGPRRRPGSEPDLRAIEERQLARFEDPLGPFPGTDR